MIMSRVGLWLLAAILLAAVASTAGASPPADALRIAWWTDVGFPTPFAVSTLGPVAWSAFRCSTTR